MKVKIKNLLNSNAFLLTALVVLLGTILIPATRAQIQAVVLHDGEELNVVCECQPTPTPIPTATNTLMPTPTPQPTTTSTPAPTHTLTPTPTDTPQLTTTNTPTLAPTDTTTPTATEEPTPTLAPTFPPTPTASPVPTAAPTDTPTPTLTPTATPTPTPVTGTYYVATDGDDDNPGTETQPFRTIQRAANAADEPGDVVLIHSGTYSPFRIRYPGAENQPITFRNYPGERPVIDGQLGSGHGIVLQEHTSYKNPIGWIVIEGLEVSHAAIDGIKGYTIHDVIIRNCEIHHSGMNNFLASGSHHITVDSNLFYESNRDPIDVTGHEIYSSGGNYWTVTNNIFYGGDWYMIQATAKARADTPGFGNITHWTIANNVFAFNTNSPGITMSSYGGGYVDDVEIFNNVFYMLDKTGCSGVRTSTAHDDIENVVVHHNLHYGNGSFLCGTKYTAWDNTDADPQFVSVDQDIFANNDFHLRSGSPAIDAGTSQSAPSHDLDGNSRPQGAGYDIGAYEQ